VLLWRGEPLADVDSEVLAARIPDLTEIYQQAVETPAGCGDAYDEVFELQRDVGNRHGEANTLDSTGYVHRTSASTPRPLAATSSQ
jgi:hypothetical protein